MKHLITIALLLAAIVFVAMGSASGFVIFLILGIVCEGAFWLRIFGKRKSST